MEKQVISSNVNKLLRKINEIAATEYCCENPFDRKNKRIDAAIRRFINAELAKYSNEICNYAIVNQTTGYGEFSCFIKDANRPDAICIYLSIEFASCGELLNDRGFNSILYRVAEDDHDWTGRSNNYSTIIKLIPDVMVLYAKTDPITQAQEEQECLNELSNPDAEQNATPVKTNNGITVNELLKYCMEEKQKGHGDYKIFITDDEEANGYHALWYLGTTAADLEPNRQYVEDTNKDLSILENKDKAIYMG